MEPGDEPFLTQSIQVHFVKIPPGTAMAGHGHQNEAVFYILEGKGHEIHDGERYDWEQGDLVVVHNDSVHAHNNDDPNRRARAIIFKAKATWMFLGLIEQAVQKGPSDPSAVGGREEWSALWTPGVGDRRKVVRPSEDDWQMTRDGRIRVLCSQETTDVRVFSIDLYEQEIAPGSRSAKHWHMADEVVFVLSGRGHSLHWDVEAEIDDRYYARVATSPSRHDFKKGELVYMPPASIHQHFNDSNEPLRFLSAQNRLFKLIGYDNVEYLEVSPEYASSRTAAPVTQG
jgi:quercetin dioxygenase-like cupin family protein